MGSIITELGKRTEQHPDKLLYAFLDIRGNIKESYTYVQFSDRTQHIASHIYKTNMLTAGDRVLLVYPPGLEMICAFFSCVRLGLIPVPVYPPATHGFKASVQKMRYIASDCGAKAILTDRAYHWSIKANLAREEIKESGSNDLFAELTWITSDDAGTSAPSDFTPAHSEVLFLQYTSGSTSEPKGVMVTHENIIHNCAAIVDDLPIGVSWLPQYHDMGLIGYYLFFALRGGTMYGFSPSDFIQRPALWLETISRYKATASSAPNFAYEYCLQPGNIPDEALQNFDLSSLTFLMTAAEPVNTTVYNNFRKKFEQCGLHPESYFAAYGLAEFTLAVSSYGRGAVSDVASCGSLLGDTRARIVNTSGDQYREAAENEPGEIWLNGKSKCAGYWDKQELTNELFRAKLDNDSEEWLRTGDLGFMRNGELYVCGRLKDTIIIRGANYYPQDIEKIVEEDAFVRKGCVAAFSVSTHGKESLVIVAGLKSNSKIPDARAMNNRIVKYLGIGADTIVFVPARTIAKTSSGKIMRFENKKKFESGNLQPIFRMDIESGFHSGAARQSPNDDAHNHSSLKQLFNRYGLSGEEHQSLGDSGLDSIRIAEFTHDLKAFLLQSGYKDLSHEVDIRFVQKIAVSELCAILEDIQRSNLHSRFRFRQAFVRLAQDHQKAEADLMRKDALITVHPAADRNYSAAEANGHILLTGGTGFFGPFLLKSLIEQNHECIYVIVRCTEPNEGKERLRKALLTTGANSDLMQGFEERVTAVPGDIAERNIGLNSDTWNFLARNIQTIYHNGALVNYLFDYNTLRDPNVNGTAEIVKIALTHRRKVLNHISTTFVFGWSVKDTLFETDFNAGMEHLDFGYSQSKWVSERVVHNAMRQGLEARIFRPALISPSVAGEGYNFDIAIRLLAFMVDHGIGTSAKNQVSFTPADMAANNIVAISNIAESAGKTFHVTRDAYSSMMDVTRILADMSEQSFTHFPLKTFVPEVAARCTKNDLLFPLLNFLVRSEKKISSMEFKRYDNSNYVKYRRMSPWGLEDKPLADVVNGIYRFLCNHEIIKPHAKLTKHV